MKCILFQVKVQFSVGIANLQILEKSISQRDMSGKNFRVLFIYFNVTKCTMPDELL